MDCALYFTHTFAERGSSGQSATTLLLDQSIVKLMEGVSKEISQLSEILCEAQLNGVSINTVVYMLVSVVLSFTLQWSHAYPSLAIKLKPVFFSHLTNSATFLGPKLAEVPLYHAWGTRKSDVPVGSNDTSGFCPIPSASH